MPQNFTYNYAEELRILLSCQEILTREKECAGQETLTKNACFGFFSQKTFTKNVLFQNTP